MCHLILHSYCLKEINQDFQDIDIVIDVDVDIYINVYVDIDIDIDIDVDVDADVDVDVDVDVDADVDIYVIFYVDIDIMILIMSRLTQLSFAGCHQAQAARGQKCSRLSKACFQRNTLFWLWEGFLSPKIMSIFSPL